MIHDTILDETKSSPQGTKEERRFNNRGRGRLRPSWYSNREPVNFSRTERARRRKIAKAAKLSRRKNRS